MAMIPTYDPLSTEARSPLIAGLTEGLNKISNILNMATTEYVDMPLQEVYISQDKEHLLYQAGMGNRLWLSSPTPIIKVNGIVTSEFYDLDCIGGSVRFQNPLNARDEVTVTATGIIADSKTIADILSDLGALQSVTDHYKGFYTTVNGLETAYATAKDGDYAVVGETKTMWIWDSTEGKWANTNIPTDLSAYITADEIAKTYITKAKATETFPAKETVRQDLMAYAVHQQFDD